jgi:transcriptional regulatory protein GAL4
MESVLPLLTDHPTTYSAIIAQSRLTSIANTVFGELISSTNKTSWDLRVSCSINHQFNAWKLSLPSYFTGHAVAEWFRGPRTIIIWKEQNLRMMLWWGSQKLCNLPSDHEEAQNICHLAAIETIQEVTNLIQNNPDIVHDGLSWYATYFLFQAAVVLSIHHLQPPKSVESGLGDRNQDLWLSAVSRARECLASLSQRDKAATRCLAVLNRLRDRQQGQPESMSDGTRSYCQVDLLQGDAEIPPASLAVDPTLQMFFEDPSWGNDLFHGLRGFPSTDEVGIFDYVPSNTY